MKIADEKRCSCCHQVKSISEFRFLNKQNRYKPYCMQCEKDYDSEYQKKSRANKAVAEQELEYRFLEDVLNQFCANEGITREELNKMCQKKKNK